MFRGSADGIVAWQPCNRGKVNGLPSHSHLTLSHGKVRLAWRPVVNRWMADGIWALSVAYACSSYCYEAKLFLR